MVKAKKNQKNARNVRKTRAAPRAGPAAGNASGTFASLLRDPCNGPIVAPYGGERGIVQRFVQDITLNTTAGHTCGYVVLQPAAGVYLTYSAATPATNGSPVAGGGPGVGFLSGAASKYRPLAACITAMPSAVSMTNMTGEIGVANIAFNNLEASGTYNTDGVFALCNQRAVLTKKSYDVKWYPSLMDGTYAPAAASGAATVPDPSDHNAILIAWRGYPASTGLSFRFTVVLEWTPRPALGLSVTSAPNAPVPHQTVAAMLHRYNPSWWHNLHSDVAGHIAGEAGKGVKALASYGVQQAVRYGMGALSLLA